MLPTIIVDLIMLQADRVFFNISGFLKDLSDGSTRYFMRSFILTPLTGSHLESDFRISAEVIYICVNNRERMQAGLVPALLSKSDFMRNIVERLLPDIVRLRRLRQGDLILRLSRYTKMKCEWCRICLIEWNWNFEAALQIFQKMQILNLIPKEAFIPIESC